MKLYRGPMALLPKEALTQLGEKSQALMRQLGMEVPFNLETRQSVAISALSIILARGVEGTIEERILKAITPFQDWPLVFRLMLEVRLSKGRITSILSRECGIPTLQYEALIPTLAAAIVTSSGLKTRPSRQRWIYSKQWPPNKSKALTSSKSLTSSAFWSTKPSNTEPFSDIWETVGTTFSDQMNDLGPPTSCPWFTFRSSLGEPDPRLNNIEGLVRWTFDESDSREG